MTPQNRSRTLPACRLNLLWVAVIAVLGQPALAQEAADAKYSVRRIWDEAPHSAFTDLIRFEWRYYCTFREGAGHVPSGPGTDGKIRVIRSEDAETWHSVAVLEKNGVDLRDPKLSVTPDGRLMVLAGGSRYDGGQLLGYSPFVAICDAQGRTFSDPQPVLLDEKIATGRDWLWRVTWHNGVAYGVVYQTAGDGSQVHLVKSADGVHYEALADLALEGQPNEATIRFRGDEMVIVVRRDEMGAHGLLGSSPPPYANWTWREMTHRLGGPDLLVLPSGELILGTRKYGAGGPTTMIGRLGVDGTVTELVELPSGGDTSYPGMVVHDETLYVSYYSSHEEKTAIYWAKIPLAALHRPE